MKLGTLRRTPLRTNLIYKYYESELGDNCETGPSIEKRKRNFHDFCHSDKGPSFGISHPFKIVFRECVKQLISNIRHTKCKCI